jgi:hypothetical protein
VSCTQGRNKTETNNASTLIYIKIEKPDVSSLKPLLLSEFVDKIDYVQLETSDQILLRPDINVYLTRDFIFTQLYSEIYQFDHMGKFIRQIGREGQGPGEFKLSHFGVDDNNHRIFVVSYTNRGPLVFDYDGKFLETINDSIVSSCLGGVELFGVGDGYFIYTIEPMDIDDQWAGKNELIVYDYIKNRVTQTLTNRLISKVVDKGVGSIHQTPSLQTLTKRDSLFYYHSFYNDTLYTVSNSKIHPFAIIDFGKWKFPNDILYLFLNSLRDKMDGKMRITGLFINRNNIIFDVMLMRSNSSVEGFLCKYDTNTKKMTYHSNMILNDIDGWQNVSINTLGKGISLVRHPDDYDDKQFKEGAFSKLDKSDLKYPEQREKIKNRVQGNREKEDNPLLMILHMKKEE